MASRAWSLSVLMVGLSLCGVAQVAQAQPDMPTPFLFATSGVDRFPGGAGGPNLDDVSSGTTGVVSVSTVDAGNVVAHGEASYGALSYFTQSVSPDAPWAASIWADGFVVTGGAGPTTVTVSTVFNGFSQHDMEYTSYVSATPFTLNQLIQVFDTASGPNPPVPGATQVLSTHISNGVGPGQGTLHNSFTVNAGESFYIASVLSGDNKSADFSHPFVFGLSVAPGLGYTSLSGTRYAPAVAVPEPSVTALGMVGLLVAGLAARQRRAA